VHRDSRACVGMSVVSSPASGTLWLLSKEQWAWTLFDAGCWGYASVTINTLVPLVFKQDAPEDERKYVSAIWANLVAAGLLLARVADLCSAMPLGSRRGAIAVGPGEGRHGAPCRCRTNARTCAHAWADVRAR